VKAAMAVFSAAALFLAGVVVGVGADRRAQRPPAAIALADDAPPAPSGTPDPRDGRKEAVEQRVEEHALDDFDDHVGGDDADRDPRDPGEGGDDGSGSGDDGPGAGSADDDGSPATSGSGDGSDGEGGEGSDDEHPGPGGGERPDDG